MGLLGDYMRHRAYGGRRRRYGYYPMWGGGRQRGRPRGGTRVHVSGCCLPIPCGTMVLLAGAGVELTRRRAR